MQRRAFEVTAGRGAPEEKELDPPALARLAEIHAPTLVLVGALDLDAIVDSARRVSDGVPNARRVDWSDTAHLPSMERPDDSSRCYAIGWRSKPRIRAHAHRPGPVAVMAVKPFRRRNAD